MQKGNSSDVGYGRDMGETIATGASEMRHRQWKSDKNVYANAEVEQIIRKIKNKNLPVCWIITVYVCFN